MEKEILQYTALELSSQIKEGKVTAVEALEAVLSRIDAVEQDYHCYVTVDREGARSRAKEVQAQIEAGTLSGPLAGVPVAIKDNMNTKGLLTTCSSKILGNFIPTFSAEAVKKLERLSLLRGLFCPGIEKTYETGTFFREKATFSMLTGGDTIVHIMAQCGLSLPADKL